MFVGRFSIAGGQKRRGGLPFGNVATLTPRLDLAKADRVSGDHSGGTCEAPKGSGLRRNARRRFAVGFGPIVSFAGTFAKTDRRFGVFER